MEVPTGEERSDSEPGGWIFYPDMILYKARYDFRTRKGPAWLGKWSVFYQNGILKELGDSSKEWLQGQIKFSDCERIYKRLIMMYANDEDPLEVFLRPPPGETATERALRLAKEAEAKRVNDMIDEQLKADEAALKQRRIVRVLLLGQAESGKSTALKNLRIRYSSEDWKLERTSWRAVIQLYVVRSIILIVDMLQAEDTMSEARISFYELLKLRLAPLRRVEADLSRRLGEATVEEQDGSAADYGSLGLSTGLVYKNAVRKLNDALKSSKTSTKKHAVLHPHFTSPEVEEPTLVIADYLEDMKALWADESVRAVLRKRKVPIEETTGFYLDNLDRIAQLDYQPTDDDVLRTRLRTLAVQEYSIKFPLGTGLGGNELLLYDVGGSRTKRHAWIPFFDNVQAIIFFAPVSCFDEQLVEDSRVNRLDDCFYLWDSVCSSKLLAKTSIVLIMNKCDLLKKKLRAGMMVKKYIPSYGDRPNNFSSVITYLRNQFLHIHKKKSPEKRSFYSYPTGVIDTNATRFIINTINDLNLTAYLKHAALI